MSDTPETDKQAVDAIGFYSCATVPADLARRLERERDLARRAVKESVDVLEAACGNGILSSPAFNLQAFAEDALHSCKAAFATEAA
jgi:hypothetical protein